jgi:hypothetical protein
VNRLLASWDAPPSGRERAIWFDAAGYGRAKLLGGAAVPWGSTAELASFVAKLQGMFRSDAILVDGGEVFAQRAADDAQLRAAMAARTRPGYALRTLLADERARGIAAEGVRALAATAGGVPLVLAVPAPGRWLAAASRQAGSDPGAVDAARAETAAMYVADMLRTFGSLGLDGLLLDEGTAGRSGLIHPDAYQSVLNVADHYGWPVLIRADAAAAWPHGNIPGVTAWLGSAAADVLSGPWGVVAGEGFWDGGNPAPEADLVLAPVPAQADPEIVMQRVRSLA